MKSFTYIATLAVLISHPAFGAEGPNEVSKGINIVPKFFQPTSGSSSGSLGFSYQIKKTVVTPINRQEISKEAFRELNLDFKAEGNVAFNSDVNPADFLKTGLELNYAYQYASALTVGGQESKCDPTDPNTLPFCEEEAKHSKTGDALSMLWGAIGSFEADQKFDKQNVTFGAHITTAYRPAIASFANEANPLDWPFRLVRTLSGHPWGFTPSPDAFPKLRLAAERVKPVDDKDRNAVLGATPDYNRANIEIAMTSPVGIFQGKQVKFEGSWRYFKEIGADEAIKTAELDEFSYFAATLKHDSGWQLTYATGKLPFDRQNEKVWELGYKLKF